uniref:Beta-defensin n=1 Tax=Cricetulus griseus TaxID=10029 RepID=A0A8C2LJH2_CRIGR
MVVTFYFPRTMRLLLLALPVLAFLPQVIPAFGGAKKCLHKLGTCRKSCNNGEISGDRCKKGLTCCIPDTRKPKQKVSHSWTTEATPTIEYDLNTNFINALLAQ